MKIISYVFILIASGIAISLIFTSTDMTSVAFADEFTDNSRVVKIIEDATNFLNADIKGISGNYLIASDFTNEKLLVWDISDRENPVFLTDALVGNSTFNGYLQDGNFAYTPIDDSFIVIDMNDKNSIFITGNLTRNDVNFGSVRGSFDDRVYSIKSDTLSVVNVSDKTSPFFVTNITDSRLIGMEKMVKVGDYIFTVTRDPTNSFVVLNVTNADAPEILTSITDGSNPNTSALYDLRQMLSHPNGNTIFVSTHGDNGNTNGLITAVDISDPENPSVISSLRDSNLFREFFFYKIVDNNLYGITTDLSFTTIDISDTSNMTVGSSCSFGTYEDYPVLETVGNYGYISTYTQNRLTVLEFFASPSIDSCVATDIIKKGNGGCPDCTPPTFGKNKAGKLLVNHGFIFNDNATDVTDFHTNFPLITVITNQINNVIVKVYENNGVNNIRLVQFGMGMPEVRDPLSHAQTLLEVWLEGTEIDEIVKIDKNNLVDILNITTSVVDCGYVGTDNCLQITLDYIYRDQPKYNIMAINAMDASRNAQTNYMNDGILVIGETLNDPLEQNVSVSNADTHYPQNRGTTLLTLVDYKTDMWQDEYGYMWSANDYGPYLVDEVPVPKKMPDKFSKWSGYNDRFHSEFKTYVEFQSIKAEMIASNAYYKYEEINNDFNNFAIQKEIELDRIQDCHSNIVLKRESCMFEHVMAYEIKKAELIAVDYSNWRN